MRLFQGASEAPISESKQVESGSRHPRKRIEDDYGNDCE